MLNFIQKIVSGSKYFLLFLFFVLVALILFSVRFITDIWWFQAAEYLPVFTTMFTWKISLGVITFILVVSLLYLNFFLANSFTRHHSLQIDLSSLDHYTRNIARILVLAISGIVAYTWAFSVAENWQLFAEFWNASSSDLTDPIFHKEIGFYFFEYRFYQYIRKMLLVLTLFSLAVSLGVYFLKGAINLLRGWKNIFGGAIKTHITILLIALILLIAWGFWLNRYQILYSSGRIFFGAGYTDVNARIGGFYTMSVLTLIGGILLFVSIFKKDILLLATGVIGILLSFVLVLGIYPWLQQKFVVEPNELEKEKPYISHNIEFTRKAYGLDNVERHNYVIEPNSSLQGISSITANIRLWDWKPLLDTYRQIQEMRLYYRFHDVDPDRYNINGKYFQVMSAARELDYTRIPEQARTWVNTHLKYTHGYGLVMSPVNEITEQGMPGLWVKDIPPVSSVDIQINRPEIYYGELTSEYIFTGTTTDEFDYPLGDSNSLTRYQGSGGVKLDSFLKRFFYAIRFQTMKLLISEYITPNTKIHYHRDILNRVKKIAPFLHYDSDPYLSVIDGKLIWIIDAYTISDRFPYAQPLENTNLNYIRNSVKVTIDAYNGNVQFYITDENDILVKTYMRIYPHLFQKEKPPLEVREHFRYPVDLFEIQSAMYLSYHMSDASVFYNREDMWRMATEMYQGQERSIEPYYVIMPLPGQETHEYLLIMPFTPVSKNNMIAWMTARSDEEHYGKLVIYEFPKKELVYGPMQIEARIDQDPHISQLITLWSQKGSQVMRGNLIVIPYRGNLLYVEPLYLQAEQAKMPELKRVIVAYKNQIVISENLQDSLAMVLGQSLSSAEKNYLPNMLSIDENSLQKLIEDAIRVFERSQQALNEPDWKVYGENQNHLKSILKKMQRVIKTNEK